MTDFDPPCLGEPPDDVDLEAQMSASLDLLTGAQAERWVPTTMDAAQWCADKLRHAQDVLDRMVEHRDRWQAQIDEWFDDASRMPAREVKFFRDLLAEYALTVRAETEQKTVPLPSATIRTVETKPRVVVKDADEFVKWADEEGRDDLMRITQAPDAKAIARYPWAPCPDGCCEMVIDAHSGERVPGLAWEPGHVSATVNVRGDL